MILIKLILITIGIGLIFNILALIFSCNKDSKPTTNDYI